MRGIDSAAALHQYGDMTASLRLPMIVCLLGIASSGWGADAKETVVVKDPFVGKTSEELGWVGLQGNCWEIVNDKAKGARDEGAISPSKRMASLSLQLPSDICPTSDGVALRLNLRLRVEEGGRDDSTRLEAHLGNEQGGNYGSWLCARSNCVLAVPTPAKRDEDLKKTKWASTGILSDGDYHLCTLELGPKGKLSVLIDGEAVNEGEFPDPGTAIVKIALQFVIANPVAKNSKWFIDEITAVRGDWAGQIKWLRDNDPDFATDTVVLTGSDAPSLTRVVGRLPGRRGQNINVGRTLLPVGFRTFVALTERDAPTVPQLPLGDVHSPAARDALDELLPWLDILVHSWESYLQYGGFPTAVDAAKRGDAVPVAFANDLFDVIFRDAFEASSLSESKAGALYSRIVEGMGSPANLASIASDIGVDTHTVIRHTDYLRDAFLSWSCPRRADDAWLSLEGAQSKLYAADPLLARLMHVRNQHRPDVDPTALAEMQIGMAVRRRQVAGGASWTGEDRLFYWRTATRKEIDFVSDDLGGAAIEGKYTEERWRQESATVNASEWRGVLATRNMLDAESRDKAWAVPAALLAFLIDT